MAGALITLLMVLGCVGMGRTLIGRWTTEMDPAARFGVGGLAGLGVLGTLTFFIGLAPGGFHWGVFLVGLYGLAGLAFLARHRSELKLAVPKGAALLAVLVLVVLSLFALVAVLAPSLTDDWDTLAYHLAVPKQWLAAGKIVFIPSLHQSNFPDVVDDLYVWGLSWGGESGAKAFSFGFLLVGIVAVYGLTRQRYGERAAWWGALAFASVPTVLWEAGTAYIDHAHGLFAGLAIAFAALAVAAEERLDRSYLALSALMVGFAVGSKYTGLQTLLVVCFCLFLVLALRKRAGEGFRAALLVGVVGLAIGAPWYAKNLVFNGNPVFPFLYEKLGGKNWDQARADIYRGEQLKFGVGRGKEGTEPLDPLAIGHATLGLAYQPGRYVNPGETVGMGFPTGAVGIAVIAALVLWPLSGRRRRFESFVLGTAGLSLLLWFVLSQQSRYITTLAPPAAILLGGAVVRLPLGAFAAGLTVLQSLYTLWLFQSTQFTNQIQVVTGKIAPDDYRANVAFFLPSRTINQAVVNGKVALYDEVFGYFLDVPYMWANPGHGTLIPYERMNSADDYVRDLKQLGFTHVYISLSPIVKSPEFASHWLASMGLNPQAAPITDEERKAMLGNLELKWQILLADAVASGKLQLVQAFPQGRGLSGMLFRIAE